MLWTQPFLLAGLGALAAPILIHFLMKARGRKVRFSTLRFLPQTKPDRSRKKIRHWWLLLLRLALLTLLVVAFARPYWPASAEAGASPKESRSVVIVLDRSASMQARSAETGRWDMALAVTRKVLNGLSANDQVALIGVSEQAEVMAPFGPAGSIRQAITGLNPTNEAGNMADGLRLAATLLDQAPVPASHELVLVSDLQKSSWRDLESISLPTGTHCDIETVAASEMDNSAVTGLLPMGASGFALVAELRNFSSRKQTGLDVACSVDQRAVYEGKSDVDKNSLARVPLPAIAGAGWHRVEVDLKNDDALSGDNRYFGAVDIPQPVRVLVAEPGLEQKLYQRSSYFVTSALDPEFSPEDSAAAVPSIGPFSVTVIDPAALAGALRLPEKPDVVIVPPLSECPPGLGTLLKSYVENGGGVLGWVGPGIDAFGYNNEWGDLWPAHFIDMETSSESLQGGGWRLGRWKGTSPLFAMFRQAGHGDLTLPTFRQRMRLEVNPDAGILATFDDKTPFLLSRKMGRGRVLLVNSSPDTQWSDWPIHKTFLPLVQQMALYLAGRDSQAGFSMGASLTPTRHGQLDLGPGLAGQKIEVIPPSGKPFPVHLDGAGLAREMDLEQPGCYEVRNARNETDRYFCVNFPPNESDLAGYSVEEITGRIRFSPPAPARSLFAGNAAIMGRHEVGPWLFVLLLVLLFGELAWANRVRA